MWPERRQQRRRRAAEVRWLNWPAYIDISDDGSTNPSIDAFKEETGLEVEYDEGLLDNAEFLATYAPDLREPATTPAGT